MNSESSKKIMFKYFVDQVINKEMELTGLSKNELLKNHFSTTKWMKLLYFVCLISSIQDNKEDIGLFSVFDNFLAYKNGPVEEDCYSNRHIILE